MGYEKHFTYQNKHSYINELMFALYIYIYIFYMLILNTVNCIQYLSYSVSRPTFHISFGVFKVHMKPNILVCV